MDAIVRFYVERVSKGRMSLDSVPSRWREEVRAALEKA